MITIIAGPCAIETEKQTMAIATALKECGIEYFRGGIFKPRSSPYRWQGIGIEGIDILKQVKTMGFKLVTEAMNPQQIEWLYPIIDVFQIGSRNMQCSEFLKLFGRQDKPVLLKRGMATTIEELIMAADFIRSEGNDKVILCERGVRTFDPYTRNLFDIACIPAVKLLCDLPIIADPSHGTGRAELVIPLAMASIAAGADGVMIEVHNDPENAMTDGEQSLTIDEFKVGLFKLRSIAHAMGREIANDFTSSEKI